MKKSFLILGAVIIALVGLSVGLFLRSKPASDVGFVAHSQSSRQTVQFTIPSGSLVGAIQNPYGGNIVVDKVTFLNTSSTLSYSGAGGLNAFDVTTSTVSTATTTAGAGSLMLWNQKSITTTTNEVQFTTGTTASGNNAQFRIVPSGAYIVAALNQMVSSTVSIIVDFIIP